jgi:hypothetical protein
MVRTALDLNTSENATDTASGVLRYWLRQCGSGSGTTFAYNEYRNHQDQAFSDGDLSAQRADR